MVRATIVLEDGREMAFELFPGRAPITTANFCQTARDGFYDGLGICRIVKGYVIQSGSPDNDIMTDSEFHIAGEFDTGVDHRRGAISMARDDDPNTAGTQFFVVHQDAHKLDGRYAAFGYMTEGFEVLDALTELETSGPETWNKPLTMPIIRTVLIETDEPLPPCVRI